MAACLQFFLPLCLSAALYEYPSAGLRVLTTPQKGNKIVFLVLVTSTNGFFSVDDRGTRKRQ
jgi:hypothetical protein